MQVTMPWLTDANCKQKFPQVDTLNAVCAGEDGGNKDTCQVRKTMIFFDNFYI